MKTFLTMLFLIPSLSWGLDKDELKEELKYWKSLLDDDLISKDDYELKKKELLNNNNIKAINTKPQKKVTEEKKIGPNKVFYIDILFRGKICNDKFTIFNFNRFNDSKKFVVNNNVRFVTDYNKSNRNEYLYMLRDKEIDINDVDLILQIECNYKELSINRYDLLFPWQVPNNIRIHTVTRLEYSNLEASHFDKTFKTMFNQIDKILTNDFINKRITSVDRRNKSCGKDPTFCYTKGDIEDITDDALLIFKNDRFRLINNMFKK